MTVNPAAPAWDQHDKKYFHCCGSLHVTKAARIIAVIYVVLIAIQLVFTLTRSLSAAFFALLSAAFSIVIFGALLYGVFKEKRLYVVPYLIFQALSLAITVLSLIIFIIMIAANAAAVVELGEDVAGVDPLASQQDFDHAMAVFTVLMIIFICVSGFVQAYFLEIIYAFYHFLKDRESSFSINFDTTVSYENNDPDVFASIDTTTPPAYDNLEHIK